MAQIIRYKMGGFDTELITDLTNDEQFYILKMLGQLSTVSTVNNKRALYYDQDVTFKLLAQQSLIQSIDAKYLNTTLGWARKTVDVLSDYIQFDGFIDGNDNETEISEFLNDNNFNYKIMQSIHSSMLYGCSFLTLNKTAKNDITINVKSPKDATCLMDFKTGDILCGLSIVDRDKQTNAITEINCYFKDKTLKVKGYNTGKSQIIEYKHNLGRPLIEAISYKPSLDKPFGISRITKAMFGFMDMGIRSLVRFDIGSEFFSLPQIVVMLGKQDNPELVNKLKKNYGSIWALTNDDDGNPPTISQLEQHNPTPHIQSIRTLANLVSSETDIPINELGFPSDNPPSDSAIYAQRMPLLRCANKAIFYYSKQLKSFVDKLIMLQNNTTDINALKELRVTPTFMPVYIQSPSASADTLVKLTAALPFLKETSYPLEQLGLSREQIKELSRKRDQYNAENQLNELLGVPNDNQNSVIDNGIGSLDEQTNIDDNKSALKLSINTSDNINNKE